MNKVPAMCQDPLKCAREVLDKCLQSIARDGIGFAAECNLFQKGKRHGLLAQCTKSEQCRFAQHFAPEK